MLCCRQCVDSELYLKIQYVVLQAMCCKVSSMKLCYAAGNVLHSELYLNCIVLQAMSCTVSSL
jgi:hypothetical protein